MSRDLSNSFQCPLRSSCHGAHGEPFPSYRAANDAVARYQSCRRAARRRRKADRLYLRHLPLVRKVLARFCPRSRCLPGVCYPEELLGETYPIFRRALDDYDPSVGVDFVGYVSQRLHWGLQHCARRLEKAQYRPPPPEVAEDPAPGRAEEERVLNRVLAQDLLGRLGAEDALLLGRYAAGHSCNELAEAFGMTPAAARKRLERLRSRLRALAEAG